MDAKLHTKNWRPQLQLGLVLNSLAVRRRLVVTEPKMRREVGVKSRSIMPKLVRFGQMDRSLNSYEGNAEISANV